LSRFGLFFFSRVKCAILRNVNKMTRRTIDETGKDISERRPELELVQAGWYWTGTHVVWVIGTSWTHQTVYYQYKGALGGVLGWEWSKHVTHWRRVHEAVQESGQRFNWRPSH
jgi:hypothetical protein